MSAVVILDEDLIAKVAHALSEMSVAYPRSIARCIRGEFFDAVVEETARILDTTFPDFESALIAAASKVREKILPHAFHPMRMRTNSLSIFAKKDRK
jgi:hypothetical protein